MDSGGLRAFDGGASAEDSDEGDNDAGEATHLVSSKFSRLLSAPTSVSGSKTDNDESTKCPAPSTSSSPTYNATDRRRANGLENCPGTHHANHDGGSRSLSTVFRAVRRNPRRSCVTVSLIVFVPLGLVSYLIHMNPILVFAANLVALIPLSTLLTYATDQIARESSDVVGALLNVTLANLVEILIFVALSHNRLEVVQASLVGSILVNLLLVLGIAILVGSFRHEDLSQNREAAQKFASLLSFSVVSLLVPNALYHSFADAETATAAVLILSRVASVTLLAIYLLFILVSVREIRHTNPPASTITTDGSNSTPRPAPDGALSNPVLMPRSIRFQDEEAAANHAAKLEAPMGGLEMSAFDSSEGSQVGGEEAYRGADIGSFANNNELEWQQQISKAHNAGTSIYQYQPRQRRSGSFNSSQRGISPLDLQRVPHRSSFAGSTTSLPRLLLGSSITSIDNLHDVGNPDHTSPKIGRLAASLLLAISAVLVAAYAEFMVDALDGIVESGSIFSEAFIGLIILPAAGNFAELFTATATAWDGNFDLAIGIAVGSAVQISLLVTPLVIIAGWIMHINMTMYFDLFGTVALFATTFLVTILILHGKSKFLEGNLLIACYFIIAVGAYLFPRLPDRA